MTHPDDIDAEVERIFESGCSALDRDDLGAAERAFREVLSIRPSSAVTRYNLALVLQHQGLLLEAIAQYERAIEGDPEEYWAFINRGIAYCDLGDYRAALNDFDAAISVDASMSSAHFNRGYALDGLGDFEGAIVAYDKAIAIEPNNAATWFNRALSSAALERHHDAISALNRAIELDPMDPDAYELRASERSDLGDGEQAAKDRLMLAALRTMEGKA